VLVIAPANVLRVEHRPPLAIGPARQLGSLARSGPKEANPAPDQVTHAYTRTGPVCTGVTAANVSDTAANVSDTAANVSDLDLCGASSRFPSNRKVASDRPEFGTPHALRGASPSSGRANAKPLIPNS
jgi:hypothetical protein